MTLVEITLALGVGIGISMAGLEQANLQEKTVTNFRDISFYTTMAPQISRQAQTLITHASELWVAASVGSATAVTTGNTLYFTAYDPVTKLQGTAYLTYNSNYECLEYHNVNGNSWYIGHNLGTVDFTLNPDGTITMYVEYCRDKTIKQRPGVEMILERR
jgi:hypothetical protein